MKSIIYHISAAILALTAFSACERFDPEKESVKDVDLPRCLKPVQVKTTVKYNTVTIDMKTFPDAEVYKMELYDYNIEEEYLGGVEDPDENHLIETITIDPESVPYTFKTMEEVTLYYRIAAFNETAGKEHSLWHRGHFKTDIDPTTICLSPEVTVTANCCHPRFYWNQETTDKYLLEIYSKSIPSNDEPSAEDRVASIELTNEQIPYVHILPEAEGTFYFRVKAIDLAGERRDSKWSKGSFKTTVFTYPASEDAVDYNGTAYCNHTNGAALTVGGTQYTNDYKYLYTVYGNSVKLTESIVFNKIYYGKDCNFNSDKCSTGGKISTAADRLDIDGLYIPQNQRHVHFLINKKGHLNIGLRKGTTTGMHVTVALLTTRGTRKSAKYLLDTEDWPTSKQAFDVDITEDDLYGITEPAQILVFDGANLGALLIYPITWTTTE